MESWGGTKEKQAYTHIIFKNATFTFTWAFQRTNQGQDVSYSLVWLFSPLLGVISVGSISISAGDTKGCKWRHHLFHTWHYKLRKLTCSLHRPVWAPLRSSQAVCRWAASSMQIHSDLHTGDYKSFKKYDTIPFVSALWVVNLHHEPHTRHYELYVRTKDIKEWNHVSMCSALLPVYRIPWFYTQNGELWRCSVRRT